MMRVMMTEEPRSSRGDLMLLHRLLDLALNLSENRMMRRPSCQMERKHRCRPLEEPSRAKERTAGGRGTSTRRRRKGQPTSWFQDHVRNQRDRPKISAEESSLPKTRFCRAHRSLLMMILDPRINNQQQLFINHHLVLAGNFNPLKTFEPFFFLSV